MFSKIELPVLELWPLKCQFLPILAFSAIILKFIEDRRSILIANLNSTTRSIFLVSLKKYMPPPLPYFKVNICPFPLPHFASIFFAYLWSFRWPNYIVTLPRYFSLRLPRLDISTGPPSDELDKNISERSLFYFKSLKRIQLLLVCAGFFICIRNSLDRPCVTMPSWSSPLKYKVSL
jgi:hypothetical protein